MNEVAYAAAGPGKSAPVLGLVAGVVLALGCTAGVSATKTGTAGSSGGAGAGPGTGGTTGVGGSGVGGSAPPIGGFGGGNDGGATCQSASYTFVPKIPTVYLVVDRSGSMFHCLTTSELVCSNKADSSWSKLKDAIEGVLTQLDSQVRFGFTTIYGTNPAQGGSCPVLNGTLSDNVPPALNNAAAIKTLYDGLAWPSANDASTSGKKLESPASEALAAAAKALSTDTTPGDKYMIFITDGQEDYCDDSIDICSSDSTVWRLQAANAAGIKTIVFGLQTAQFNLADGVLQAFANAGAGEPTVAPLHTGGTITDFYYQCNGGSGGLWLMDFTTAGKTASAGATLGTYSTTAGPTKPYTPNASDQTMLATQLAAALSGVKSCTFDLTDVGGKSIMVDLSQLSKASIKIEGNPVALDAGNANGWDMISATQLELFGTACDTWRDPNVKTIDFNFPCEIIVE